jgi:hypothetical protein
LQIPFHVSVQVIDLQGVAGKQKERKKTGGTEGIGKSQRNRDTCFLCSSGVLWPSVPTAVFFADQATAAARASTAGARSLYITGVTSRARIVDDIRPPMMTHASGE